MKTLIDLFLDSLADIYDAENQLVRALSKMAKLAADPEFRKALESHWKESLNLSESIHSCRKLAMLLPNCAPKTLNYH